VERSNDRGKIRYVLDEQGNRWPCIRIYSCARASRTLATPNPQGQQGELSGFDELKARGGGHELGKRDHLPFLPQRMKGHVTELVAQVV
jgi:hypothetical protein